MATRGTGGRWLPGQSANPNGRKPGSGKLAKLRATIAEAVPEIVRTLIANAKAGDVQAAKLLIERAIPPLRPESLARPLGIEPQATPTEQARAVLGAVARGELGINEAVALLTALGTLVKVREADEIEQRLSALEGQGHEHGSAAEGT